MRLLITSGGMGTAIAKEALVDRHQVMLIRSNDCFSPFAKTVDNLFGTKWDVYLNELVEHWNWCERYRKQYKELVLENPQKFADLVFSQVLAFDPHVVIFGSGWEPKSPFLWDKMWGKFAENLTQNLNRVLVVENFARRKMEEHSCTISAFNKVDKEWNPDGKKDYLGSIETLAKTVIYHKLVLENEPAFV